MNKKFETGLTRMLWANNREEINEKVVCERK